MYSPALHSQLIQTHKDELHRAASGSSLRASARRQSRSDDDAITDKGPIAHDTRSTYRFLRHYAEMVAVMFAGMFALMAPTGVLLSAFGTSWSRLSPAMNVLTMALTMTVPMVAWMRYRAQAWRPNIEMAASMLIPTFIVMGVLSAGGRTSGSLMVPEHAGMLTCMLVAMLFRRDEYSCAARHHGHARPAIAA